MEFRQPPAKSALHLGSGDGTNMQWQGQKVWVAVEEAKLHGIEELLMDSMRENPAGAHRLSAWLACDSFQWWVLDEGDTSRRETACTR